MCFPRYSVSHLEPEYFRTNFYYLSRPFMARRERIIGRPYSSNVSSNDLWIAAADRDSSNLAEHLARAWLGYRYFLNFELAG